jgi:hypothetical protein
MDAVFQIQTVQPQMGMLPTTAKRWRAAFSRSRRSRSKRGICGSPALKTGCRLPVRLFLGLLRGAHSALVNERSN